MLEVKCKLKVQYDRYNVKKNGDIDLNVKSSSEELVNVLKLIQMLGRNITVKAKVLNKKPFDLGTFVLKNINIDRDGESKIRFNTEVESSEIDKFIDLIQDEYLVDLLCKCYIENDETEEDEGEDID